MLKCLEFTSFFKNTIHNILWLYIFKLSFKSSFQLWCYFFEIWVLLHHIYAQYNLSGTIDSSIFFNDEKSQMMKLMSTLEQSDTGCRPLW